MSAALLESAEWLHEITKRLVRTRFPPTLEPRKARMMWLIVALYCEMQDVAIDAEMAGLRRLAVKPGGESE